MSCPESANPDYAVTERLPWHGAQWRIVEGADREGRLHHALLLRGPRGVGKRRFAGALAASLLCTTVAAHQAACGRCRACKLRIAGNHPDLHWLVPEPDKRSIGVDAVRALIDTVALTSQSDGPKVVVVAPAEALTHSAANTLLKTLEEPPGACVFLLVAERAGLLLPTIRSRCQALRVGVPGREQALSWMKSQPQGPEGPAPGQYREEAIAAALEVTGGAPLAALDLLRNDGLGKREEVLNAVMGLAAGRLDPGDTARRWGELGLSGVLDHLEFAACALLKASLAPGAAAREPVAGLDSGIDSGIDLDIGPALDSMPGSTLDLTAILALQAACTDLRRTLSVSAGLNEELALAAICAQCARLGSGTG